MTTATFLQFGASSFVASRSSANVPDFNTAHFGNSQAIQRLAGEYLGFMSLTLTNIVVGSRIRIELQVAGTLVDERTATGTSEVFSVPYYSGGDPANDLRVKVRKGTSAPKYQPFETLAVAAIGTQSVYIAQVADPIA